MTHEHRLALFHWLLSYLFNALWQIPLVFAAAWVVNRMLRSASPRAGHRVWVAALSAPDRAARLHLRIAALWYALLNLLPTTSRRESRRRSRTLRSRHRQSAARCTYLWRSKPPLFLPGLCCLLYFAGRLVWGLQQTRTPRAQRNAHHAHRRSRTSLVATLPLNSASALRHRRLQPRHMELAR